MISTQALVDVAGAVAERLEGRRDEALELLDRRLAEDGRGVADEVLPELARVLGRLGGRGEPHQPLLEPLLDQRPLERLLGDEDDPVPAPAQHVADPDAVVGRAVGALGEEGERLRAHTSGLNSGRARLRPAGLRLTPPPGNQPG